MADSEEYPGPYCMKNGISTDWLISLLSNSKDGPDQPNVPDFNDPVKIPWKWNMPSWRMWKQVLHQRLYALLLLCLYPSVVSDGRDMSCLQIEK